MASPRSENDLNVLALGRCLYGEAALSVENFTQSGLFSCVSIFVHVENIYEQNELKSCMNIFFILKTVN